ncbi:MAG: mobile mystery protein A [Bacteroidia bacterium]
MKDSKQWLLIGQIDKKLESAKGLDTKIVPPANGWINGIRKALKMSLRQLGLRLKKSPQNIIALEIRETTGAITINTMKDVARALDMKFVYAFVPKDLSLEEMIEKKAREKATEIVQRTSNTMMLENQENTSERLQKAIKDKTEELKNTIPKYLWD